MSARDKLLACFPQASHLNTENRALIEAAVDEILNDHAHELAEEIRAEVERINYERYTNSGDNDFTELTAMEAAADLIDPETHLEKLVCGWTDAHTPHRFIQNGTWYICNMIALNGGEE